VRDVLEAFEGWLDQQVLTPEAAEHARFVLAYLQMDQPLPACLRAALAEHVEALKGNDFKRLDVLFTHETNTQPLVLSGFRQSVLGFFGVNRRQQR